jgi:hypothetical protein
MQEYIRGKQGELNIRIISRGDQEETAKYSILCNRRKVE